MLTPLQYALTHQHEQLNIWFDRPTGLRAIIALHDTQPGAALGGVRLRRYDSADEAALDAARLAEGMTYKAALAGLPLGGGKTVVMADGQESDPAIRRARFQALGRLVESLNGRYIAAEDMGTTPADMIEMRRMTAHVAGLPREAGGGGDPSPMTAFGVFQAIRALVEETLKTDRLTGIRVAIQGLGKVGWPLAEQLSDAGAVLVATDAHPLVLQRAQSALGIRAVAPDAIYDQPVDIFAPCAIGAILNDATIPRLACKIVAGSANNQLEDARHGELLHTRGIVYGVDYLVNAGGLINVAQELEGYDIERVRLKTARIYDTTKQMLAYARAENISTARAALQMAEARRQAPVAALA